MKGKHSYTKIHDVRKGQEVFSVQVLPVNFPELINEDHELPGGAFYLPPQAMAT